jgi:cystathionine beta-lyase
VSDDNASPKPDTVLVTSGRRREWAGRIVNPPVYRGSTVLFDSVAEIDAAKDGHGRYYYGQQGLPNQWALAEALSALEPGAGGTMLYPTGLSAVSTALLTILSPGDELLMVDSVYGPTRRLCDGVLKRLGITTRYYDPTVGGGIAELFGERTRAVFTESPGSLTFEVQDVPAIAAAARERSVAVVLDNSWATPLLFPALAAGVDMSVIAGSKYIGGHSDLMLGAVTATPEWFPRLERTTFDLGHQVGPDDAWLALRGLRTLGVRLRSHEAAALRISNWLKERPEVGQVLHPALPDCPGHELWRRDFKGSAGLFAFSLDGAGQAERTRFIEALKLFPIGWSWGGYESLVSPVHASRTASRRDFGGPLIRLQIGLEDPDDLIADLEQALAKLR